MKRAKEFGVTMDLSGNSGDAELDPLVKEIAKGHNYHFIGKVGQFCPIKPGCGGGILLRETEIRKPEKKDMRLQLVPKASDGWSLRWFGNSVRKTISTALTTTIL